MKAKIRCFLSKFPNGSGGILTLDLMNQSCTLLLHYFSNFQCTVVFQSCFDRHLIGVGSRRIDPDWCFFLNGVEFYFLAFGHYKKNCCKCTASLKNKSDLKNVDMRFWTGLNGSISLAPNFKRTKAYFLQ